VIAVLMKTIDALDRLSTALIVILSILLVLSLGVIDYLTGKEISFSIFYLLPITIASWSKGRLVGVIISILSAITWLVADLAAGATYSNLVIPFWNMLVRFSFFIIIVMILSAFKEALEQAKESARKDPLTGVANARFLAEFANSEINRARRYRYPLTIFYLDLDNFKSINDIYGHSIGDELLQKVGLAIKNNIRKIDLVARLGGDEFAAILPDTGAQQARSIVERVHRQLSSMMNKNGWSVTASIGVVTYQCPPPPVDQMINRADHLMYSSKKGPKGKVRYEVVR
jgi:diguanylate cyclase (GGDEF)-like protein